MIIRKANTDDTDQLEILFQITRQKTFVLRQPDEFEIGDYQKSTAEDEVWVAEESATITGFVSFYVQDNFIHNLFIHPNFQRQGIGKFLLLKAEELLLKPITLKIAMDNLDVCKFYEKYGYHKISTHQDEIEPYLLYEKK